jgi:hypothetical protein
MRDPAMLTSAGCVRCPVLRTCAAMPTQPRPLPDNREKPLWRDFTYKLCGSSAIRRARQVDMLLVKGIIQGFYPRINVIRRRVKGALG